MLLSILWMVNSCTKDKLTPVEINTPVSFSRDIYPVFKSSSGHCDNSGCHTDEFSLPWFTSLDSCYTSLLRDTSINLLNGVRFVNREHPEDSYLYQKLTLTNPAN